MSQTKKADKNLKLERYDHIGKCKDRESGRVKLNGTPLFVHIVYLMQHISIGLRIKNVVYNTANCI